MSSCSVRWRARRPLMKRRKRSGQETSIPRRPTRRKYWPNSLAVAVGICDEKKWKKPMTYLETSNADSYEAATELEERISQLTEQLQLKGHQVKELETNMEEVTGAKYIAKQLFICDEKKWKKPMTYLETSNADSYEAATELEERISQLTEQLQLKGHQVKELETNMEEMKGPLLTELQQKVEETEMLKMELQMLETERVRLSLVEEKLMDVLQLLQQLRDLNISKRALGKILLNTLESCHDPQHGKANLFEVLDTLYHELTACEILQSQPLEKAQSRQSLSNPLVISC
ncbi:hypothetical protein ASZ78_016998 [Callipepla squamata]|uniref:Uncharacterized protein n=1 Tax=Callipepla squamata TaxID=9009 RepID=A0A226NCP6_CALSU|nr:hypothetical protein ASZ78_016998 [Callipepla squamata]